MASLWYPKFKEALLTGAPNSNPSTGNVKVVLVDGADYTYSDTHEFLSDVPSGARVATSGNLTNKTFTNGLFDADNITLSSVTGDESELLIVYIDTGTATTSRLMVYLDTFTSGMPVLPNGGNIEIQWGASANRIGQL